MFMRTFGKTSSHPALLKRKRNCGGYHPAMRVISLVVLISVIPGCFPYHVPENNATLQEAFPSKESHSSIDGLPAESYRKATFDAGYEDVYRAVVVAATQGGLMVDSESKVDGIVYGTKQAYGDNRYYAITIRKADRKKTDVIIFTKMQSGCQRNPVTGMVVMSVITLGLFLIFVPALISQNKDCDEQSHVHWSKYRDAMADDIIVRSRQNLYAAGAM